MGRRRQLPGSRAVIGGLLVTLAAVGTFVASTSATSGPTAMVVVAARPIGAGEHLTGADLRTVPADLPGEVRSTLFASVADLEGSVALAPLRADQAVTGNDVSLAGSTGAVRTHDLSFALERDRALNGRIQPGDLVNLVATFESGADARTEIVVRRVRVADLDAPTGSSAGASAKVTITLAFATEQDVLLAANALEVAKVTLSRTTGTETDPTGEADPVGDGARDPAAPGSTVPGAPAAAPTTTDGGR